MSFNRLWLTDFKIRISPSAREKQVRKRFVEEDIQGKWEKTSWAKRIAMRKRRKTLTDFDRFKLKVLKQQVCVSVELLIKSCGSLSLSLSLQHTHTHTTQKSRMLRSKFNEMKHELKNSS